MIGYFILLFVLLAIGAAAFYYFNTKNKKEGVYLWVGPGPDPFKTDENR